MSARDSLGRTSLESRDNHLSGSLLVDYNKDAYVVENPYPLGALSPSTILPLVSLSVEMTLYVGGGSHLPVG